MQSRIEKAVSDFAGLLVDSAQRAPWRVMLLASVMTIAAAWLAATRLVINTDPNVMLSEELAFRATAIELAASFPSLQDNLVIVVEAERPETAREAATKLATTLRADSANFETVFAPQISKFFDDQALLYLDLAAVEELSSRVEEAAPWLSSLSKDPSLARVLGSATAATRGPDVSATQNRTLDLALAELAVATDAWLNNAAAASPLESWLLGSLPGPPQLDRYLLLVRPVFDFRSLQPARKAVAAVRQAAKALEGETDVSVRITGDLALITEEMILAKREAVRAAAGSFALVVTLLLATLLSARLVLAIATTLLAGLIWTAGFAAYTIGHLNLLSLAFAVLFVGLGVDFGIHFGVRFRELRDRGVPPRAAISESGRSVGSSLVLCAFTTAIGFYAFLPTRYAGVAELGLISGTGMFFSLAATLLLLPAILVLAGGTAPRPKRERRRRNRMLLDLPSFPLLYPRAVCATAVLTLLPAAVLIPQVWFDSDPLNVRDPKAESVQTMRELLANQESSPWNAEILIPNPQVRDALLKTLRDLPEVRKVVTIDDYYPAAQTKKLELFASTRRALERKTRDIPLDSLFAGIEPAKRPLGLAGGLPFRGAIAAFGTEDNPSAVSGAAAENVDLVPLRKALAFVDAAAAEAALPPGLAALYGSAQRVLARVETAEDPKAELHALESRLLGDLPELLSQLRDAIPTAVVDQEALPLELSGRYVSSSGVERAEVYPALDVTKRENLEQFADAVRGAHREASGPAILIVESARAIVDSLKEAMSVAFVTIAILLAILWRSGRDMVLAVIPLFFASAWTAATSVYIGLPMNFADIVVVPLLFGMGIDSGIHLVHRHRSGDLAGSDVLHTSTARAVVFSSLTTMASFASLSFSHHRGIASLGLLLTIGMAFTLVANLCVLPALLSWLAPSRR